MVPFTSLIKDIAMDKDGKGQKGTTLFDGGFMEKG